MTGCFNIRKTLLLLTGLLGTSVSATEPTQTSLTLSVGTIPFVLHEDHPGPHNELFHDIILKSVRPTYKINMIPHYRANRDFLSKQSDCLYITVDDPPLYPIGSSDKALAAGTDPKFKDSVRFSQPFNQIRLHVYTRAGDPIINDYSDMSDKVIIGVRTQLRNVQNLIQQQGAIILYIEDYTKGFQLLDKGRADAIITYSMDVQVMLEAEQAQATTQPVQERKYGYHPDFTIRTVNEIVACWRSSEADIFLDRVNVRIAALRKTGYLKSIFANYQ